MALLDLSQFGRRLAGARGERAVSLAGQAIGGVALGIVLVALGQALLAGIGLAVAGVPFAVLLTALMFLCGVVQVGVVPVLLIAREAARGPPPCCSGRSSSAPLIMSSGRS